MLAIDGAHDHSDLARHSSRLEKLLEYHFLAQLGTELYRRGIQFSVLRDDVDGDGRDLLIEADGIFRHIQLKGMVQGGARGEITVNCRLATKRSACIIWFSYDPATLELGPFRWLGGAPGEYMPDLGERVARSTRANMFGSKPFRSGHRVVGRSRFEVLQTIAGLADRLFGPDELSMLLRHLEGHAREGETDDIARVRSGMWDRIPSDLTFDTSSELAMLIDGYQLLQELGGNDADAFLEGQWTRATVDGRWHGTPAELWITLFLEHRRQRFAGDTWPAAHPELLDTLVVQLRSSLML